jgi:pimeloyl-ACP methyl ester carboxylesterase
MMPFISVHGKKLHYADTKPDAPSAAAAAAAHTIVFVHGLGSTQNYLAACEYRCITFDNYGAGRSGFDRREEHSIESIGRDVVGLLDALHVARAVVVGYSMGGMLPTSLASTVPDRVVAGVCIGPVHPTDAVAELFKQRIPAVRDGEFSFFFSCSYSLSVICMRAGRAF